MPAGRSTIVRRLAVRVMRGPRPRCRVDGTFSAGGLRLWPRTSESVPTAAWSIRSSRMLSLRRATGINERFPASRPATVNLRWLTCSPSRWGHHRERDLQALRGLQGGQVAQALRASAVAAQPDKRAASRGANLDLAGALLRSVLRGGGCGPGARATRRADPGRDVTLPRSLRACVVVVDDLHVVRHCFRQRRRALPRDALRRDALHTGACRLCGGDRHRACGHGQLRPCLHPYAFSGGWSLPESQTACARRPTRLHGLLHRRKRSRGPHLALVALCAPALPVRGLGHRALRGTPWSDSSREDAG